MLHCVMALQKDALCQLVPQQKMKRWPMFAGIVSDRYDDYPLTAGVAYIRVFIF